MAALAPAPSWLRPSTDGDPVNAGAAAADGPGGFGGSRIGLQGDPHIPDNRREISRSTCSTMSSRLSRLRGEEFGDARLCPGRREWGALDHRPARSRRPVRMAAGDHENPASTGFTARDTWHETQEDRLWMLPLMHAVRCCRLSGLIDCGTPDAAGRVHIACQSATALRSDAGSPDPVSLTVCPSAFPATCPHPRRLTTLSGGGGIPASLLFRHQRPDDARHSVGQCYRDEHPGEPGLRGHAVV